MAQNCLWNLAKEKMKERGELPYEGVDVVREYKAMHGEDFWSSWLREDDKSKERKAEAEGKEKKRVKRGQSRRRKKRTKRGRLKEDMRVCFCGSL